MSSGCSRFLWNVGKFVPSDMVLHLTGLYSFLYYLYNFLCVHLYLCNKYSMNHCEIKWRETLALDSRSSFIGKLIHREMSLNSFVLGKQNHCLSCKCIIYYYSFVNIHILSFTKIKITQIRLTKNLIEVSVLHLSFS